MVEKINQFLTHLSRSDIRPMVEQIGQAVRCLNFQQLSAMVQESVPIKLNDSFAIDGNVYAVPANQALLWSLDRTRESVRGDRQLCNIISEISYVLENAKRVRDASDLRREIYQLLKIEVKLSWRIAGMFDELLPVMIGDEHRSVHCFMLTQANLGLEYDLGYEERLTDKLREVHKIGTGRDELYLPNFKPSKSGQAQGQTKKPGSWSDNRGHR